MLQEQFLENLVQSRIPVTIYLMNGIRLLGQIESFDQYGLVLGGTSQQFVYKHAISTIVPTRAIAEPAASEQKDAKPEDAAPPKSATTLRPRVRRSTDPAK